MEDIFEELAEEEDLREIEDTAEEAVEVPVRESGAGDGEEQSRKVDPKKPRTRRPRLKLDAARLKGPRGFSAIEQTFSNFQFKGKGYELEDLTNVLNSLQHWAHRLYPRLNFEDCIQRIEELSSKKQVMRAVYDIRMGMTDAVVVQVDEDEEAEPEPEPLVEEDPFDKLLGPPPQKITLTDEQRARMLKNRLLAEERRMAKRQEKLKHQNNSEGKCDEVIPGTSVEGKLAECEASYLNHNRGSDDIENSLLNQEITTQTATQETEHSSENVSKVVKEISGTSKEILFENPLSAVQERSSETETDTLSTTVQETSNTAYLLADEEIISKNSSEENISQDMEIDSKNKFNKIDSNPEELLNKIDVEISNTEIIHSVEITDFSKNPVENNESRKTVTEPDISELEMQDIYNTFMNEEMDLS